MSSRVQLERKCRQLDEEEVIWYRVVVVVEELIWYQMVVDEQGAPQHNILLLEDHVLVEELRLLQGKLEKNQHR